MRSSRPIPILEPASARSTTATALLVAGVAAGLVSAGVTTALASVVGVAVPMALVGGLVGLVRRCGFVARRRG